MKTVKIYFNDYNHSDFCDYATFWDIQNPKLPLLRDDLKLSLKQYRYIFDGNTDRVYAPYREEELKEVLKKEGDYLDIISRVNPESVILLVQQNEEIKSLNIDDDQLQTLTYIGEYEIKEFWDNIRKKKAIDIFFYSGRFKPESS